MLLSRAGMHLGICALSLGGAGSKTGEGAFTGEAYPDMSAVAVLFRFCGTIL